MKFASKFNIFLSSVLLIAISFSVIKIVSAVTPNPGHSWTEVGDGIFTVAGPTVNRTFTFPDADASVVTGNGIVKGGIISGTGAGTFGITTVGTDGQILSADSASPGGIKWITGGGGGGSGTVTSVSVVTANGVSGSVATDTTTPAITLTLGAITPTTVNGITFSGSSTPTLAVTGTSTISGTNTGDQTTISGNAGTATALQTPRTIGGVSFDGTGNITVASATGGFTVSGGDLALGANNITMTGSIGTTGSRLTKGWFTDLEVTNAIVGNITGNAATVTTNANLTGAITSSGNATSLGSFSSSDLATAVTGETGTGALVFASSPTLVTPTLGVATATSVNKLTITAPATSATLTIDDGFTLHATGNVTALSGSHTGTSSGTNTGDQTITLTGDITGSGTGSFATAIGAGKVTNTMLAGSIEASKLVGTDIATVGTITSGTWNGTIISPTYGGTGVNNGSATITLANNLTTAGNFALTLTQTGVTNVTLPTSGTLYGTATGSITSLQLLGSISDETGSGALVFANSPVFTTPNIGSATGSISGNAGTATALQTPRTIGGVSFDGTGNITVASATGGFTVSGGDLALGANNITMTGSIGTTGSRLTKGWFTDLEVTNAIVGNITGNAATVTTNANLTGAITSSGNATSLGSFSSSDLATAVTGETGTGALVFGTAPTFASTVSVGTAGGTTGAINFNGTTSGIVTLKTADAAGTYTLTLPTNDGDASQFLQTNGSGVLTWATGGGGGGLTVGTSSIASGSNGNILYNNAGTLGEMTTTGSGTVLALATSPSFITPSLGVATATGLALTSTNTTQTTTSSAFALNANSLTSGTGLYVASSTLTSGKLIDLQVSGTDATASQTALNILTTGATSTNAITTYGAQISNTHTNATSGTNVALYLNASGATTANYGLIVNSGKVGIGTTAPAQQLDVLDAGSAQLRLTSTAGSVYSEIYADATGDLQISATGGDIRMQDNNLWVCAGGSCGANAPVENGNIVVETSIILNNNFRLKQTGATTVDMMDSGGNIMLQFDEASS
jgi:hypothetical protein